MAGKDPWPFPRDPLPERLRWVARSYRASLHSLDPGLCGELDALMTRVGQGWITTDPDDVDPEQWIGHRRAAELLSVHPDHVSRLRRTGRLRGRPIGRSWQYRTGDVLALTAKAPRNGRGDTTEERHHGDDDD